MISALYRLCLLLALLSAMPARADAIEVQSVELELAEERYLLRADFGFELSTRLEEALSNGVPLNFLVEFELKRPRWYWLDERAAAERMELRLAYLPLTQQYRITGAAHSESFSTLAEALRSLGRVRGWPVFERKRVDNGERYTGAVRMRLDTAQLPKPVQVSAVTNREWTLASDWRRFAFTPLAPVREAR